MIRQISIVHLIPSLAGGGAEHQLSMLVAEQTRRGWSVHVGIRRGGVHEELLRSMGVGVTVHWLGDHTGFNPRLLRSIDALFKQIKPDIVQTWLLQMDIVGGIAALWNSVPWIVSERTSELCYKPLRLQAWARYSLARYASAVVANSSGGVAYWRGKLPTDSRTFQIANAIDVAAIRDVASVSGGYSNSYDDMKEILVVGRLSPEKGLEIVIKAVRMVPIKHTIRVSIIGEGPLRKEIEVRITEAGLDNRISLLPYSPSWWGLLKNARALVSMSRFEGQPNVILETMAAGCPLIVSDIPAHREFLDEDSAILVPLDNPVALAEAIVSLLADPVSARERAQRASGCVDGLTIQSAADAYESVYEEAMCGRKV